jgi:dTDP-glucose 4,6-dehydratase
MQPSIQKEDLEHILEHTEGLWEALRGQSILLTGGTGLFGKWLVAAFCRANDEYSLGAKLVVLNRNSSRAQADAPELYCHPNVHLHPGDFQSFEFPTGGFRYVIHAATETDSFTSPIARDYLYEANVAGTRRVLALAARAGTQRLLNVSSGAVYGPQPLDVLHIAEDSPVAPDTARIDLAYGHSKRASEFLVAAHAERFHFEACSARCFTFVGAYLPLDTNFAIGNFIGDALHGRQIQVNGDGTPLRSYLYMADLAVWLWVLLLRGQNRRCYNVGSDQAISIAELARLVVEIVNPSAKISVAKEPTPGQPPLRYVPSIGRARSELQLQPWVELGNAIERTVAWNRLRLAV